MLHCRTFPALFFALLAGWVLLGCEDSIGPPSDGGVPYSLYGYLDASADTQAVIVIPVRDTLGLEPPRPLNVRVTTELQETGAVQVWRDSLVTLPDGRTRHVFWAPFRAEHGGTYRFIAERADGERSGADAFVPQEVEIERLAPVLPVGNRVLLPVDVRGAPQMLEVAVRYTLSIPSTNSVETVVVPYEAQAEGSGRRITIDLSEDARALYAQYGSATTLRLIDLELRFFVASNAWAVPDDPQGNETGQPSNVVNGYGFVGGGYTERLNWLPADSLRTRVGL